MTSNFTINAENELQKYTGTDKTVIIPDVKTVKMDAFVSNKTIEEIVIPKSVKLIDYSAFRNLTALGKVTIEREDTRCEECFIGCKKLETIIASDYVLDQILNYANSKTRIQLCKKYLKEDKENNIYNSYCKKIRKTLLPVIISEDDDKAFSNYVERACRSLSINEIDEFIEKSSGKTKIQAFLLEYKNRNYSEKDTDINKTVNEEKELGIREKTLTNWRKEYGINKTAEGIRLGKYKGKDSSVIIPSLIQKTPVKELDGTFSNNQTIQEVTILDGIEKIDGFSYCENLTSVNIPDSVKEISIRCFEGCCSLASIQVPEHTTVGVQAFKGCNSLADSNGFVVINHILYDYIGSEEDVFIPDEVEEISVMAFSDNNRIRKVIIGENVRNIGYYAFAACGSLKEIRMNGNVSFDESVFEGCSGLTIYGPKDSNSIKCAKSYGARYIEE